MESRHSLILLVLTAVVGALWFYPWLDDQRVSGASLEQGYDLIVTSSANSGPGSLREAFFRALRSTGPSLILLRTKDVVLETPLPPLISRYGITLRSEDAQSTVSALSLESGPVLDLRAGRISVENVAIRSAPEDAIRVSSAEYVSLAGIAVSDSDVGVSATGGFQLSITQADFADNRIGVELLGRGAGSISNTSFTDQAEAGVWAVGSADSIEGSSVQISSSRFQGARYGLVLGNVTARLQDNRIDSFAADGIHALGGVLDLTGNQLWNGRGTAIRSIGQLGGSILANEVHENSVIGIIVQSAAAARVEDNHVYRNTYGIVTVLNKGPAAVTLNNNLVAAQTLDGLVVIGDSPRVSENRALQNRSAGIRVFNLALPTAYVASAPILVGNILTGNGLNEPVFSEYRAAGDSEGQER